MIEPVIEPVIEVDNLTVSFGRLKAAEEVKPRGDRWARSTR